jgi:tetratricopeptide (TPR) repeat protein
LAGGDAWDAKIKKQIKECALFVPVISAATNARAEGYFRLEWKLAVDRSHLMADDAPFLFPVVIGDAADATAREPDKFREVQWTRLRLDETPAELATRVAKLILGSPIEATRSSSRPSESVTSGKPRKPAWIGYAWTVVGLICALVYGLRPVWRSMSDRDEAAPTKLAAHAKPETSAPPVAPTALTSAAVQDPQIKRAMELITSTEATAADVALAEDLVKAVLSTHPTDAAATLAMGRVQVSYLLRGFDRGEERFARAKLYAERGLTLAPDDPDAIAILATYLYRQGIELPRAIKLLRQALALRPEEPYYNRILDNVLSVVPGVTDAETIASAKVSANRRPGLKLCWLALPDRGSSISTTLA